MLNFEYSDEEEWMSRAIEIARHNFTPYGCIILDPVSSDFIEHANSVRQEGKTAHAEMNALRNLKKLKNANRKDLVLYSTGEPCPMCMGAIIWAGITNIRYGMSIDEIAKFHRQITVPCTHIAEQSWLEMNIKGGIMEDKCRELFKKFVLKPT
jgi:tRNA(adenine34) deaminase